MAALSPAFALYCCPETHQPLAPASAEVLEKLKARIVAHQAVTAGGQPVLEPLESGLVRSDGKIIYPIRKNLPVLLREEGILL